MKARIPPKSVVSKGIRKAVQQYAKEQVDKEEQSGTRRILKLVCVALHQKFGFGKTRISDLVLEVNNLALESDNDEIFWNHVDRVVIDEMGVDFKKENEN